MNMMLKQWVTGVAGGSTDWSSYWTTREPSDAAVTITSDTTATVTWTDSAEAGADGYKVYAGAVLKATVAVGAQTADVTGLTTNTQYTFKVVAYKGVEESIGDTASDWTAMKIPLAATGTGAGVANTRFYFSGVNVVVTLDGNGRWYSDAAGTLNESTSYTFTAGSLVTRYLKVTSGNSNMLVFAKNNLIQWGNAGSDGWTASTNAPNIAAMNLSALPSSLTHIQIFGNNTVTGGFALLTSLQHFSCSGSNTINGVLSQLSTTVTLFNCSGSNTISGNLSSLTALTSLNTFSVYGTNTITGDVASLPDSLLKLVLFGSNTISGDIGDLPPAMTWFDVVGTNTIGGDLADMPQTFTTAFCNTGTNTITGDIANLPPNLIYTIITGYNTCYGDIADLSAVMRSFNIQGLSLIDVYTSGHTFPAVMDTLRSSPVNGHGLDVTEITNLLIDIDTSTTSAWIGSKTLNFGVYNASMADTSDPGIWGTYSGVDTPSDLAIAYKSLSKTKTVTVTLTGIVKPAATGDGTGFPAGFGDWYRS